MATLRLRMPILRNLALLSTNGEEFRSLICMTPMQLFGDTPLLSTLDTVDIGNLLVLGLPYHQITHHSNHHVLCDRKPGPSTYYILPLLSAAENLETCDLRCKASEYPRSVLARLLNALTLPFLSTLTVHCCMNEEHVRDTEQTLAAIREAICPLQSPLTTFHFIHGDINEEDLLDLFRGALSTLQAVKLLDVGPLALIDDILTSLEISNPDDVLLPRLHALHISGEMKFDANLLVKMVKSRWACVDDRDQEELGRTSALSKLEEYRAEGLKLSYNIL
ncbi:hypothetical protein EDD85DRAFT_1020323 [Armillaria nabsnona]|nr:hypothetical protein EDD85DRAFT_1020323 [Armillaria nabsnona]